MTKTVVMSLHRSRWLVYSCVLLANWIFKKDESNDNTIILMLGVGLGLICIPFVFLLIPRNSWDGQLSLFCFWGWIYVVISLFCWSQFLFFLILCEFNFYILLLTFLVKFRSFYGCMEISLKVVACLIGNIVFLDDR